MKISVADKKEIKLEEEKYYLINFEAETIEDIYYMKIDDLKRAIDIDDYVIIEVERGEIMIN